MLQVFLIRVVQLARLKIIKDLQMHAILIVYRWKGKLVINEYKIIIVNQDIGLFLYSASVKIQN